MWPLRFYFEFTAMSLRIGFEFTLVLRQFRSEFPSISLRIHLGFTSVSLRFHFDLTHFDITSDWLRFTLILQRFRFDVTSSSLRAHFGFILNLLRFHLEPTATDLRIHFDFNWADLDSPGFSRSRKGKRKDSKAKWKREIENPHFYVIPARYPERAHARKHSTTRNDFSVGLTPQTPML